MVLTGVDATWSVVDPTTSDCFRFRRPPSFLSVSFSTSFTIGVFLIRTAPPDGRMTTSQSPPKNSYLTKKNSENQSQAFNHVGLQFKKKTT